jgi:hypothetical protein
VTGFTCIIAPWCETLRYAPKKHGYHGGATPQEVLVPIGVFARSEDTIEGWKPLPDRKPAWWNGAEIQPVEVLTDPPRRLQRRSQSATRQASLFTGLEASGP